MGAARDDVLLTKAVRATLRAELRRTGVTAIRLCEDADDLPDGLTAGVVNRWLKGLIRSAPRDMFEYVVARWAALPDDGNRAAKRGKGYAISAASGIEITDAMAAQLRAELARTNIGHATLLDGVEGAPAGLTARIIRSWLYQDARTAKLVHWEFVMAHLATMPNFAGTLPPLKRKRRPRDSGNA